MVAGKPAFVVTSLDQVWEQILKKVPESPRFFNHQCPQSLANLISNLLEKKTRTAGTRR
jgi:hypothetical protein